MQEHSRSLSVQSRRGKGWRWVSHLAIEREEVEEVSIAAQLDLT